MTFKTSLFMAIQSADHVSVNAFEVENSSAGRNGGMDLSLANGETVHVTNREIEIDDDGDAIVPLTDTDENGQAYNDLDPVLFSFRVEKPLTEGDML